jgi:hypothetical protein
MTAFIVKLVLCPVKQGDWPLLQFVQKQLNLLWLALKFLEISSLKLVPFHRIMAEPLPQLSTWCDISQPNVNLCPNLG